MGKEFVVYRITNTADNMQYIGITNNFKRRMYQHEKSSKNCYLHNAIKKHGWARFNCEIIDRILFEDLLLSVEKDYIRRFNTKFPNGYNLTDGGEGNWGWNPPEQTRRKMSENARGKKVSDATRKGMSDRYRELWKSEEYRNKMMAIRNSDEYRRKQSVAQSGKKHTPEEIIKMSERLRGRKLSEEHKRKIGIAHKGLVKPHPKWGHHSEETKKKLSVAIKAALAKKRLEKQIKEQ